MSRLFQAIAFAVLSVVIVATMLNAMRNDGLLSSATSIPPSALSMAGSAQGVKGH